MPDDQAKELMRLIESAGVFDLEQKERTTQAAAGPADVVSYRLSVSDGPRQKTLWFNDVTAPASVQPLLAHLRKLAIEQKKKRTDL